MANSGSAPASLRTSAAYGFYALALLTCVNLLSYINRSVIFSLFTPIERDLHLRDFHVGWLASAYVLVYSLFALPLGILSDLRSRRAVVAAGIALWSVFTALGGLSEGFGSLVFSRAMVGVGGAAAAAAATSLVADYYPGQRRAFAMGIYQAGIALGGVLGILLGGQLEAVYGWRVALMAVGLPGFALAFLAGRLTDPIREPSRLSLRRNLEELGVRLTSLVRFLLPLLAGIAGGALAAYLLDRRYGGRSAADAAGFALCVGVGLALNIRQWVLQAKAQAAGAPRDAATAVVEAAFDDVMRATRVVLQTPTLAYIFVGGALISFGINGLVGWAPTYMSRALGVSIGRGSVLLGKWGLIFGILGTLFGGFLADWSRRYYAAGRVLVVAAGFLIGAPLAAWLLTIRDIELFVPVFCAAFFFLTWYSGPLTAAIFDVVPARVNATVVGAYLLFIHLAGDTISFPIVGALSDRFGIERATILLPAVGMLGGLVVLGAARTVRRDMERAAQATGEWRVDAGHRPAG